MDDWIKTTERLPKVGQRCIVVWADQSFPHTATIFNDELRTGETKWIASNGNTVKHNPVCWMPCPAMPIKEKNNG